MHGDQGQDVIWVDLFAMPHSEAAHEIEDQISRNGQRQNTALAELCHSSFLKMKLLSALLSLTILTQAAARRKRQENTPTGFGFENGPPQSSEGKGGPLLGGTNHQVDLDNKANLGQESTDNGVVPNLKWRFSDSHTRLLDGGWVREQVVMDSPESTDIAAAQQHLHKGAIREIHWHRVVLLGLLGAVVTSEHGRLIVCRLSGAGSTLAA